MLARMFQSTGDFVSARGNDFLSRALSKSQLFELLSELGT